MHYFDRVQYSGTKTSASTFGVTVTPSFKGVPDNTESEFFIYDDNGNFAGVIGVIASGVLTLVRLVEGYTLPNFASVVTIVGTYSASSIFRKQNGVGGIGIAGQSNVCGYNDGRDLSIEYPRAGVTEFHSDRAYSTLAQEPFDHDSYTNGSTTCVTFALHYAERVQREGFQRLEIVAGGQGSTSFSGGQWIQGGANYTNFKNKVRDFLLADPSRNYLHSIVMGIGESDTDNAVTQVAMQGYMTDFATNIRADILADTGVNISTVPIVWLGMSSYWTAKPAGPDVEAALASAETLAPFMSYVEVESFAQLSGGIPGHLDAATHRRIGMSELIFGYNRALTNQHGILNQTVGVTADLQLGDIPFDLQIDNFAPVSAAIDLQLNNLTLDFQVDNTAPASVTANISLGDIELDFQVEEVQPVNVTAGLQLDDISLGLQVDNIIPIVTDYELWVKSGAASPVNTWANTGANATCTLAGNGFGPANVGGIPTWDGGDIMNIEGFHNIANDPTGYTMIFDVVPTDLTFGLKLIRAVVAGFDWDISWQAKMQGTIINHTGATLNTRQWLAATIDRAGDIAKVYIDGVEVGSTTPLAAQASVGTENNAASLGYVSGAFKGETHNIFMCAGPLTGQECIDVVAQYFEA